ncbi:hypothetical protein AUC47_03620 [Microbacterium sp. SZ1]|uniref:DUF4245 family protein n=1 Tax=Microbacterium sp. SZ1 TaxID=1849736 RepID=UPI000BBC5982|nr:DUF4245 family protein [Microbacterium sp. SZ1]PCE14333.1 hypothetical protein AUC47_03620 [Microbacterium sp. SZ1]
MSKRAPIVAELGRPETPEETAARKAEFSKAYRSSQTVRGLIAALLATLAIVVVIVLAVPRGEPATEREVDVTGIAADVESSLGSPVIVPELDDFWRVNAAGLTSGATPVWDVTLAPAAENERGFIKLAQAFGVDSSWAPQRLNGVAPTDTTAIGGIEWDVYSLGDAGAKQNVTYAIGTQAGDDYVLLYGSRSADSTADLAETLVPQIRDLSE